MRLRMLSGNLYYECLRTAGESLVLVTLATMLAACSVFAQAQNHSRSILEGFVVDSTGAPISEAQVLVASAGRVFATTNTGDDGGFQIHTQERQSLTLVVKASGFATHEQQLLSSSRSLKITLSPSVVSADVTIAATRVTKPRGQAAASVVILDAGELNSTAAVTLDDSLRQVPGFSLFRRSGSRTANPTSQGVSLRGIGASGASRALVQADGIPLNDPFGGWVYWNRVPRESISRVEILLGGASHLYGSTALAGLIDIATRKTTANHLSLSASYGNQNTPNASLFMSGSHQVWSGSLAAEIFRTNGYVLIPENQRGLVDTPAGSRDAVMNLRLERSVFKDGRIFGNASFFGESRKNGTVLQTNRTHVRQFVLGGDFASETTGAFVACISGGTQLFDQNFSAISPDRNSEALTRVQRVPAQVVGLSGQWSRVIAAINTVVAGAEAREVRGASDELVFVNGRASSLIGAGGRERTFGLYVEDLVQVGTRIFVNLGVRFDRWRHFGALSTTRSVVPASPIVTNQFPDRSEHAGTGHASALYRISEHVSAVVSFSKAFRAPTLNELYRSFRVGNVLTLANENLRAERLTGGEAGLRVSWLRAQLEIRSNVFWNEIGKPVANVTLQTTPALITRQRQNLGLTRSRGGEVHTEARFARHWYLSAGYLLVDSTVVRFPPNAQLEGLRLPQVARHQFTFQLRVTKPSIMTVGAQGRMASSQFDDDQNLFRLGPYFTLDTFVSRDVNNRLQLFCAIENILNQRYEVGKIPVTTLGPPILVRAGFRVQLGSN
jgi:outer membrane receptor protein involved in Fe transport